MNQTISLTVIKNKRLFILINILVTLIVSLSINVLTYSLPAFSAEQNNQPVSLVETSRCFICSYQDLPECASGRSVGDCSSIKPADGLTGDCQWIDNRCQNRFQVGCANKLQQVASNYNWANSIPYSGSNRIYFPPNCTARDYYYSGHSNSAECPVLLQSVQACISGMVTYFPNGTPLSLNFVNDGCSTFANQSDVMALAQRIQANLPIGLTVTVTGNQTTVNNCNNTTHMTITITRNSTTVTYGPCLAGNQPGTNNFCAIVGERARCTNSDNQTQNQTCCDTGRRVVGNSTRSYTSAWFFGIGCPTMTLPSGQPPLTTGPSQGSCHGIGSRYWCGDATTDASTTVQSCLGTARTICGEQGRTFIPGQCARTTSNGVVGVFGTCNVDISCPWICRSLNDNVAF